jgi:hypothetical protein
MKRKIFLGMVLFLLMAVLVGCGGKPSFTAFLTSADIDAIEVFTGGTPSQAYMKIVTAEDDIQRILDGLNALSIVREAKSDDYLAGGVGTIFSFRNSNEHPLVVRNHGNLIYAASGNFVVSGTSLDTDEFWNSLQYEEIKVGQNELPVVQNIDAIDYSPTILETDASSTNNVTSTYISDDGLSRIGLRDNGRFYVEGRPEISYIPTGNYEIDGNKLILNVYENQQFIFIISENSLIFENGEWLENWIPKGTVFTLLEDEN